MKNGIKRKSEKKENGSSLLLTNTSHFTPTLLGLVSLDHQFSNFSPALGAAELPARIDFFGEGCLSGASSRAILIGVEVVWGHCLILNTWFFLGLTSLEGQLVVTGDADSQHQVLGYRTPKQVHFEKRTTPE